MKSEKGIEKIAFPVRQLVECTHKSCKDYGDYFKCYFDEMYLQCLDYNYQRPIEVYEV